MFLALIKVACIISWYESHLIAIRNDISDVSTALCNHSRAN